MRIERVGAYQPSPELASLMLEVDHEYALELEAITPPARTVMLACEYESRKRWVQALLYGAERS